MEKYQDLSVWAYSNSDKDVIDEYQRRFNPVTTLKTGLFINPIFKGQRVNKTFELFLLTPLKMLNLQEKIMQNSKRVVELRNMLPPIASTQLFNHTLVKEIISTNEIEDIKITAQEVNNAIASLQNEGKKDVRLVSCVKMYQKIENRENLTIKQLTDIREIYDFLLKNEVDEANLPDGDLFRNSFARIGTQDKTIHTPKQNEKDLLPDLMQWISFINNEELPALFKAFIAHYYFEYIHPFKDGNGRTGRYIACVYLGYKLDPLTAITFSSEINANKNKYYKAFENVSNPRNFGEITFFVMAMLEILCSGQAKLLADLEEKNNLFSYGASKIDELWTDEVESDVIFLHFQSTLFNDNDLGLEDRELYLYAKKGKSTVKKALERLTKKGILLKTKGSPLARKLSQEALEQILS